MEAFRRVEWSFSRTFWKKRPLHKFIHSHNHPFLLAVQTKRRSWLYIVKWHCFTLSKTLYSIEESFPAAWPEERVLTHLLHSCAAAPHGPFKSLRGSHPLSVDVLMTETNYELKTDAPGELP